MTEEDQTNRSIWGEFAEALEKHGKRTGISIEYDREGNPTFRSGNKVGFIGYTNETGQTCSIVVEPKIPDSAVGMLCATLGFQANKAFDFQDRQTNSSERPCSWLAAFFIRELEYFLTNIRPRGEDREEELHGRIKGRMLMSQYVKRNYLQRRIQVPCRYLDWTMNNLPNQILKSTLKRCLSVLRNQAASDFSSIRPEWVFASTNINFCISHAPVGHRSAQSEQCKHMSSSFTITRPVFRLSET